MKKLTVCFDGDPKQRWTVGHLLEKQKRIFFQYDDAFLQSGYQLSPFHLPLKPGVHEETTRVFAGLHGLFYDSLPDGWGLLLMDRAFRQAGHNPYKISPLDRLSYVGTSAIGALSYHPAQETRTEATLLELQQLAEQSQQLLAGKAESILPELFRAGGSPGGARPKVLVGISENEIISGEEDLPTTHEAWLIKFPGHQDSSENALIEMAYSQMAKEAGITVPPVRLFETTSSTYFGIQRFDRAAGLRSHSHSLAGLIHSDFRVPDCDYETALKVTASLTKSQEAIQQFFLRMIFNLCAHNRDDHTKNTSFLMPSTGKWQLSPAYDLTFAEGPGGEHTMSFLGEGRQPSKEHLYELGKAVSITHHDVTQMLIQVQEALSQWSRLSKELGISSTTQKKIQAAMNTAMPQ